MLYLQIPSENCIIRNCNETQKVTRIVIGRRFGTFKMGLGCLEKCGGTELSCASCEFRAVLVGESLCNTPIKRASSGKTKGKHFNESI